MAKAIKAFRGSIGIANSNLVALYTVPTGRVAKVTIGQLYLLTPAGVNQSLFFNAGGNTVFSVLCNTAGLNAVGVTSDFSNSTASTNNTFNPGAAQKTVNRTNDARPYGIIDSEIYLIAGDTISYQAPSAFSGNQGFISYSFSAVEEF